MKKALLSGVILLSFLTVGCGSDTVVLKNNVLENDIKKDFKFSETKLELKGYYEARKYTDEGVLTTNLTFDVPSEKMTTTIINEKGIVEENELNMTYSEFIWDSIYNNAEDLVQITQSYDKKEKGKAREYYFRDNLKDITIRLDGFNEIMKKYIFTEGQSVSYGYRIPNNDNYYLFCINTIEANPKSFDLVDDKGEQQMVLVDIKHKKAYYLEKPATKVNEIINSFYFDKSLNSIMAITYDGKVKKVNLNKKYIELEEYKALNLQGHKIHGYGPSLGKISDSEYVIGINSEGDNLFHAAIYNSRSAEITLLDEEIYFCVSLKKYNLLLVNYKKETYVAQLKDDYSLEYLYKVNFKEKSDFYVNGIINEAGDKIFISKYTPSDEKAKIESKTEFSFLNLKKK